jgi:hypothetical protein
MAGPAEPIDDLGYMAWAWCVSSKPSRGSVNMQAEQVRVLADAYGADSTERVLLPNAIIKRQFRNKRFWTEQLGNPEELVTSRERMLEVIAWSEREAQYTEVHRATFVQALQR